MSLFEIKKNKQFPKNDCGNLLHHLDVNHSVYICFPSLMMCERRVWRLALLHLALRFSCTVNFAARAHWRLRRTSAACLLAAWYDEIGVWFHTESWWTAWTMTEIFGRLQPIRALICIARDWMLLRCYDRGSFIVLWSGSQTLEQQTHSSRDF